MNLRHLVFCAAVSVSGSQAFAADRECLDAFSGRTSYPEVNLNIRSELSQVEYDHSISRDGLTSQSSGIIAVGKNNQVNGLTHANLEDSVGISFQYLQIGPGENCVWPDKVDVRIEYSEMKVFVANDFAPGSCPYNVTMEHEQEHVRINRETLKRHVPFIRTTLEYFIKSEFPKKFRGYGDPTQAAVKEIQSILRMAVTNMTEDRDHLHAQLDSPTSYSYWQSLCQSWN